ncbi:MAG: GNVR domain-containing protein [Paracoccaceae bacterium]
MNLDLNFYFAVFLRRIHYFIVVFALVVAAAIAAAVLMPPVYSARTLLMVEGSQIPGQLDAPRVQAAALEKLQRAENFLMTRSNLLEIAKKLNVFKDMSRMTPDDIVGAMRDNTMIFNSAAPGEATIMEIAFEADTGAKAAGVVNELVTLVLQSDIELRTSSAENTLEFFNKEVRRLSGELDILSAKKLRFQDENADALPSTLSYRLNQQQLLQDRLAVAERNIAQLTEQKARMVAIFNSTGKINTPTTAQTPEAQQLDQLRTQLNQLLAVFTPTNPKVRMVQQQISQLEEVVKSQIPTDIDGLGTTNPAATMLDVQLADLDTRIGQEKTERDKLVTELSALKDTIDRSPAVQIALDALDRDYQNIQQQYNTAIDKQASAAAGESIELNAKGERMVVVDAATIPDKPTRPNRTLIAAGGVLGGAFLGVTMIVLIEMMNRAVRRPKDLIRSFGITPIATIPYIRTPSETMFRRTVFTALLALVVIGIPAIIYAVHVYYQPLDIIVTKVAAKLGIRM